MSDDGWCDVAYVHPDFEEQYHAETDSWRHRRMSATPHAWRAPWKPGRASLCARHLIDLDLQDRDMQDLSPAELIEQNTTTPSPALIE